MTVSDRISETLLQRERYSLAKGLIEVPAVPGYYAIFVDSRNSFPEPFKTAIKADGSYLIYIGIATKSLKKRLLEQDLRHKGPSTFFRGVAPILGFRPPIGSLISKKNQNNYIFNIGDTEQVIEWMKSHLSISWFEDVTANKNIEGQLIAQFEPLLNTVHNPHPLEKLAWLRRECRRIALTSH